MDVTRRGLLRTGGLAVAAGVAGCAMGGPPSPVSGLAVSVRAPFDTTPPVAVPIAIDCRVRTVDDSQMVLRDVELVAVGTDRELIAVHALGDFTDAERADIERDNRTYDGQLLDSVPVSDAEWSFDLTIETPTVPSWLTFQIGETRVGRYEQDGIPDWLPVGRAAARPPPPHVDLTAARLRRSSSQSTRSPAEYDEHQWSPQNEEIGTGPLFPPADRVPPGTTASDPATAGSNVTAAARDGTAARSPVETDR